MLEIILNVESLSAVLPVLPEVTERLRQLAQPGDVILTVGAGDIYRAGEALLK